MVADIFSELNFCRYIYLREVSEPGNKKLRLVLEDATPARKLESIVVEGVNFTDLRALESTEFSRPFEVTWDSYIAYTVRDESMAVFDPYEVIEYGQFEPELLRVYSFP